MRRVQRGARLRHTVEYGEEAQRSWRGCSGARMPRYLRDGALDPFEKTSAERKPLTEPSSRPRNGAPRFIPPERTSLTRKGWEQDPLIAECYRRSVDLLLRNSSPHGILASAGPPT